MSVLWWLTKKYCRTQDGLRYIGRRTVQSTELVLVTCFAVSCFPNRQVYLNVSKTLGCCAHCSYKFPHVIVSSELGVDLSNENLKPQNDAEALFLQQAGLIFFSFDAVDVIVDTKSRDSVASLQHFIWKEFLLNNQTVLWDAFSQSLFCPSFLCIDMLQSQWMPQM